MKTTLTLLLASALALSAQAQDAVPVTFSVDMSDVEEFDPGSDTLRVAGAFQTPNEWTPRAAAGDNILTDDDGDGIYTVTYDIVPGDYAFKYVINIWNGTPRGANENTGETPFQGSTECLDGNGNRPLTVTADGADLPTYVYNSCEISGEGGGTEPEPVAVTFSVDMNGAADFDPDMDTLRIAGSLQGWMPRDESGDNILTDDDGNGVYTVTLDLLPGSYEYKYVINIWSPEGFNEASDATPRVGTDSTCFNGNRNRPLTVTADGADLPTYLYNSCEVSSISNTADFTELAGVSVSPNPATDRATVALPAGTFEVRVLDATGRVVRAATGVSSTRYELDAADLSAGLYLVEVVEATRGQRAVLRLAVR